MEIILQQDFPSLGYVGDRIKVKGGYARNFLLPRGIGIEATSANAKQLRHRVEQIQAKRTKLKAAAQEIANRMQEHVLEFTLKLGEQGKAFGSITSKDIEQALRERSFELDRKQIRINESIRGAGEYRAEVKLHAEVSAQVTFKVATERVATKAKPADDQEATGKKRGKKGKKGGDASEAEVAEQAVEAAESDDSAGKNETE